MTQPSNLLAKIFQGIAVLAITALFVGLGFWQLQRAGDLKESLKVARTIDTNVVTLQSVAQPRQALGAQAFNRTVSVTGKYIANFKAPNQDDGNGVVSDWEVALAQVDERSAILVVRGLWSDRLLNPEIQQSMNIEIEAEKIEPKQLLGIFRIVEQALLNSLIHGPADKASVTIAHTGTKDITLIVSDNGPGVGLEERKFGVGSAVIDSWVSILKGRKEINSSPGNGYKLEVTFPRTPVN
jgi:hypothetical protein